MQHAMPHAYPSRPPAPGPPGPPVSDLLLHDERPQRRRRRRPRPSSLEFSFLLKEQLRSLYGKNSPSSRGRNPTDQVRQPNRRKKCQLTQSRRNNDGRTDKHCPLYSFSQKFRPITSWGHCKKGLFFAFPSFHFDVEMASPSPSHRPK